MTGVGSWPACPLLASSSAAAMLVMSPAFRRLAVRQQRGVYLSAGESRARARQAA